MRSDCGTVPSAKDVGDGTTHSSRKGVSDFGGHKRHTSRNSGNVTPRLGIFLCSIQATSSLNLCLLSTYYLPSAS